MDEKVKKVNWPLGVVGAVLVGILADWQFEPFIADASLGYYLKHLYQLQPITIIMIVVGAAMAYWMGVGSTRRMDDKGQPKNHD